MKFFCPRFELNINMLIIKLSNNTFTENLMLDGCTDFNRGRADGAFIHRQKHRLSAYQLLNSGEIREFRIGMVWSLFVQQLYE